VKRWQAERSRCRSLPAQAGAPPDNPELKPELDHVVNAFDPWARDRGEYYSLEWKARKGAESDVAFKGQNGRAKRHDHLNHRSHDGKISDEGRQLRIRSGFCNKWTVFFP